MQFLVLEGSTTKRCRVQGGHFKMADERLNLRALKFSPVNKMHIFQCMGRIFCVEFQRGPLKFHTKYLTHILKDAILYSVESLKAVGDHKCFWNAPLDIKSKSPHVLIIANPSGILPRVALVSAGVIIANVPIWWISLIPFMQKIFSTIPAGKHDYLLYSIRLQISLLSPQRIMTFSTISWLTISIMTKFHWIVFFCAFANDKPGTIMHIF